MALKNRLFSHLDLFSLPVWTKISHSIFLPKTAKNLVIYEFFRLINYTKFVYCLIEY